MPKQQLSKSMTVNQFENGYWYADELRTFAQSIGIPSATKLRKDELEKAVKVFLRTGKTDQLVKRSLTKKGVRDIDKGLHLSLRVINYTSNKQTKTFIAKEAQRIVPGLKKRSGVSYRLNRWREEQLTKGRPITYGDLVKEYIRLNQLTEAFAKIPHVCYVNFLSDFLAAEKNATKEMAISAWKELKAKDIPKTYRAWKKDKRAVVKTRPPYF